jgi:sugar lactone lactonase YvrE
VVSIGLVIARPADACPLMRTGGWGSFGSAPGQFSYAHHLGISPSGEVYVGDLLNHRVQRFDQDGVFIGSWSRSGVDGVGVAPDGTVYVVGDDMVTRHAPAGALLGSWGGTGSGPGQFQFATDVVVDTPGFVYVADTSNHRIQKFTAEGGYVTSWGTEGSGDGQFLFGWGVAIDPSGHVVVADSRAHRIQVFTPEGVFVRAWGVSGSGDGQFESPGKPAFDSAGNVVVPDGGNSRLQVYTPLGAFLCTWGSEGNGPEQLFHPTAVVGARDVFFVMDKDNHRIVRLASTPTAVHERNWTGLKTLFRAGAAR